MKTITINITHDEVFEDFKNTFSKGNSPKISEMIINDDNIVLNITGTLEELEND